MALRIQPVSKKLLPLVDGWGRMISWKCSRCLWTAPLAAGFAGLGVPPSTLFSFSKHSCSEYAEQPAVDQAIPA